MARGNFQSELVDELGKRGVASMVSKILRRF